MGEDCSLVNVASAALNRSGDEALCDTEVSITGRSSVGAKEIIDQRAQSDLLSDGCMRAGRREGHLMGSRQWLACLMGWEEAIGNDRVRWGGDRFCKGRSDVPFK